MKRILFVDDEPLVLQGLERMLRGRRHEWQMEFAENAAQALDRLAAAPFDVIVSDMRMPGMNGAQLLTEVMRLYPQTIRIILSGHADKELILQCVGSTHQYLSKPCDSEALKAIIQRASSLEYLQQHGRLRALVGQMKDLPTIPALYTAMVEALSDPETSVADIGELVGREIGMTAQMLKLVNSAFFGLSRPLTNPTEAVNHLGLVTVKSLVLAIGTFGQLKAKAPHAARIDQIWNHSVAVSAFARAVAAAEGADRKFQDEAYVSGLLHDIGKLVLLVNLPEEEGRMLELAAEKRVPEREAELEVFGADHADVGGYLLGLWGLPVPVVEAVALHHRPSQGTPGFAPLTAVHAANALVHGAVAADASGPGMPLDGDYLRSVGLFDRLETWRSACRQTPSSPSST